MSKVFAYVVLAFLALAGSMFSCAHGRITSSGGISLLVSAGILTA